jgi:hypothetical protein
MGPKTYYIRNKFRYTSLAVIVLIAFCCKKETTYTESQSARPATNINPEKDSNIVFYFRGTINGIYKDWTIADHKNGENLAYRFNAGSGVDTLGSDCINTFCKYMIEDVDIFQNNGPGPTKNYIAADFYMSSKTGNRNDIINQYAVGPKAFGKPRLNISDPVKDGIDVYYIDENGKEWSSFFGSGDQTNSYFNSVQLLDQPFPDISCRKIWRASFSCTLYDRNDNSIKLDSCEFFTPAIVNF